jgi:tetratricopeptide (TPR) repeat protein
MSDSEPDPQKRSRLRRLCQILAAVAILWAIVTAVRAFQPPPSLELAREDVKLGRFDAAIGHYLAHLSREPNDWGARLELGLVLREVDLPQALVEFRKVPPDAEGRVDALRQIASICLATERFREAEEALLELEQKAPEDGAAQLALAELYFRQGEPQTALPYAQKSAELNPDVPRAHSLLAEIVDDLNRPVEMIEPLHRVLELDPESYAANLNLSYAYSEAGEVARSRHHAEWCLKKNPADIHARRYLALALRDQGEPDEALLEIERALELAPGDLEARLLEAELLIFQSKPDEAFQRLEPFGEQFPDDRRVAALLARSAAASGRTEEAEKYSQQVQRLTER